MIVYKHLSDGPGVYQFINKADEIIYIGKAINLRKRVASYTFASLLGTRTKKMVSQIDHVETIETDSEFDALLLEAKLIRSTMPKYNVIWRDDKHPLYIKISSETYPKISTSRKESEQSATYFGPFMSSKTVKQTLRFLREVVPFCTEKSIGKRPCFNAHIGLCNPCPNEIEQLPSSERPKQKQLYVSNIKLLKRILNGKSNLVIRELTKQMKMYSLKENYRSAARIKKQLDKLYYLTKPRIAIAEYLKNPNLASDIRNAESTRLASTLEIEKLTRIEGYDISNTMGTSATGSMVVFVDAVPDKSKYRRFKIKGKSTPDDYAMMQEVLTRRLKHADWSYPDLYLIDGGVGQVSAVLEVFERHNVKTPVVGLAKRLEELIIPTVDKSGNLAFKKVRLKNGSPELSLIQRIRDEAHRFAKAYHVKMRSSKVIY